MVYSRQIKSWSSAYSLLYFILLEIKKNDWVPRGKKHSGAFGLWLRLLELKTPTAKLFLPSRPKWVKYGPVLPQKWCQAFFLGWQRRGYIICLVPMGLPWVSDSIIALISKAPYKKNLSPQNCNNLSKTVRMKITSKLKHEHNA